MRNKLIELIQDATDEFAEEGWKHFECVGTPPFSYVPTIYRSEFIADHLLANGVTIISSCEGCLFSNRKRPQKCSCCRRNKDMADLFTPKSNVRHWSDYPPKEEA